MNKLEQAARQALEALIEANVVSERYQNAEKREQAITALREALAEQAEQEPVAIKQLPDPYDERDGVWFDAEGLQRLRELPVGTKLYAAPQPVQEPVHEALQIASVALQDISCSSQTDNLLWWQTRAREAQKQIAECLTNAAPVQKTEQEPDCVVHNTDTPSNWSIIKPGLPAGTKLYTAPVRTKDLTDDEISKIWDDSSYGDSGIDFARAVIAADREKNK